MLWLAVLVAVSPVLMFKGLTLETLWGFFNVHPFWFMFTLGLLFSKGRDCSILDKIQENLNKIKEDLERR